MKKPFVGITPSFHYPSQKFLLDSDYIEVIYKAGGIPIVLPYAEKNETKKISQKIDALLLTGGGDVHPFHYGQEPVNTKRVVPERDKFEIELIKLFYNKKIPVLGICRGAQIINVAFEGTLIQNIAERDLAAEKFQHWQDQKAESPFHTIKIEKNTLLHKIFKKEKIYVNSFHHQSIGKLGRGLLISAKALDGIVEAIEHKTHPFLIGVQFHIEWLWQKYPLFLKLFREFVKRA